MSSLKHKDYNILTLVLASFFAISLCLLSTFFFEISMKNLIFPLFIFFVFLSIISFFLISLIVKQIIIKKVVEIYCDIFPILISSNPIRKLKKIDSLVYYLKKISSEQDLKMELLKKQENYRKDFIGNISHELKTPLFTIQGYVLTLLEGDIKDDKIREKYLKQTAKGADRLMFVINDLDMITKFESGIESLNKVDFDLRETIKNVFDLLEIEGIRNEITLRLDRNYETPINVFADEERIQQVLTNLIINSLKYGIKKGVTEVSIEHTNDSKIWVRINDNGDGIAKEHLPRLFERFYRVDKGRDRGTGGSGLGLAIVKHIIEAHNEEIFVESKVGIGSEFSFSLSIIPSKEN